MRPLKVRAWDEKRQTMIYGPTGKMPPKGVRQRDWFVGSVSNGDLEVSEYEGKGYWRPFPLTFFTGLLDLHGKEIWEGDKLKSSNGLVFVVTWNQERFGFQIKAKDKHGIEYEKGFQSQVESDLEVIGNIFEGGERPNAP